jgi:hypothetical protein
VSRTARAAILAVCLLAGLLATAAPALAATITVDVGADDSIDDPGDRRIPMSDAQSHN